MAVVTNTLFSQTTGEECPNPGIGLFQRILVPALTSQCNGRSCPTAMPDALCPRNCGQFSVLCFCVVSWELGLSSVASEDTEFAQDNMKTKKILPIRIANVFVILSPFHDGVFRVKTQFIIFEGPNPTMSNPVRMFLCWQ